MKKLASTVAAVTFATLLAAAVAAPAHADSFQHSAAASTDSAAAGSHLSAGVGHSVAAGASVAVAAVAIPLVVVGEVSAAAGNALWDAGQPLEIDDPVIVRDPSPAAVVNGR